MGHKIKTQQDLSCLPAAEDLKRHMNKKNEGEQQYLDILQDLLNNGLSKADRTNTGTLSTFGRMLRFDLQQGFPLLTTKKLNTKAIIVELLWFLSGDTNIKYLNDHGVHIWDAWAKEDGGLGKIYGYQWRHFGSIAPIDQIEDLICGLKNNPHSRRHVVTAWNPEELDEAALPPCHILWQCYVIDGKLSLLFYMRSSDVFIGLPFNIASYALLTHMIAQQCDFQVRELVVSLGDTHLYQNHLKQAKLQLQRAPRPFPQLHIKRQPADIFSYHPDDFEFVGYDPHPHIKAPVAV